MSLRVGIDFGTSNSGVAVSDGRQVRVLPIDAKNIVPEVVKTILYITRDGEAFIGQEAVELYYRQNIGRARSMVKKRVGEVEYRGGDMFYVTDVYAYIDELAPGRLLQYLKTALRSEGYEGTRVFERFYPTTELIAIYLRELKRRAEAQLGEEIEGATLGRPVHFSDNPQRDQHAEDSLFEAARQAGFKDVEFEFEPVAAAMFYESSLKRPQDALIFNDLAFTFYRAVEEGKIALSSQGSAVIRMKESGIDLWELYTRGQFEKDIREYREKIEQVLLETLQASGREPGQIDAVVTTGGSSSIPAFGAMLARIFGADKLVASDAFSSVSAGLGIKAGMNA